MLDIYNHLAVFGLMFVASVAFFIGRHGNPCQSLTKREYFAAMAMQGLLSNSVWIENVLKKDINPGVALATASVESADALISEMERTKS
jgi:hypothetical protein